MLDETKDTKKERWGGNILPHMREMDMVWNYTGMVWVFVTIWSFAKNEQKNIKQIWHML